MKGLTTLTDNRVIMHIDMNNFYASVECLLDSSLDGFPVVVCGKTEDRHGIVLAKNMLAKKMGVKTGMVLFEAKKLCPNLKCVQARHDLYIKYSRAVGNRAIVVIHGYGSHGRGGLIKEAVKEYLPLLKKKHIITDFVLGENWGDTNESKIKMCQIFKK